MFTPKMKNLELASLARFAFGNGVFDAAPDLHSLRTGARKTEVYQTPSNYNEQHHGYAKPQNQATEQ